MQSPMQKDSSPPERQDPRLDDALGGKFSSWSSYSAFARRIHSDRRYVWSEEVTAFLGTVLATASQRESLIRKGSIFYRAQKGVDYDQSDLVEEPVAYRPGRMKPLPNRASEGRANPAGIPVLYMATKIETAVAETRPWIGAEISLGTFRAVRDLKLISMVQERPTPSVGMLRISDILGDTHPSDETILAAVWADIDQAFSRPVSREDSGAAEYAPTQILTELFKDAGYDGIAYNSNFGGGHNVALFDITSADIVSCAPYRVASVGIQVEQFGNAWYSKRNNPTSS